MESIQYLLHQQINKKKWDNCIDTAANGLLYATSTYLDCMAVQWDALVLNDYEIVMPLPCRKKYSINYLFQPSITPALGVIGNGVTAEIINAFLHAIPNKFKVWDISFNSSNKIIFKEGTVVARNNYVLDLSHSYNNLKENYSENINRNIAKAIKSNCFVKKDILFDEVAAICKKEFPKFTNVENGLFEKLHEVYKAYKNNAAIYGVFKEGNLLASCIFLFFKTRTYYWLVGNTPESKQYGASALLVDSFIQDHAGKNLLLDFEGSDTESVADFYKKFGAVAEPYTTLFVNKLPFPFSLVKPLPQHYKLLISK
jgi:Acetyltransferase (GNAT) domain